MFLKEALLKRLICVVQQKSGVEKQGALFPSLISLIYYLALTGYVIADRKKKKKILCFLLNY